MNKLKVNEGQKAKYACMDCNAPASYFSRYDMFACIKCDIWLDPCGCGQDDNCPFWNANLSRKDRPSLEDCKLITFVSGEKK